VSHSISFLVPPAPSVRYDNALAETINGLYKTEVIRRLGPWRGDVPPVELEHAHYHQNQPPTEAA